MKENNKDYKRTTALLFDSLDAAEFGFIQWRVPDMLVGPRIIEMAMLEVASFSDVN